MNTFYTESVSCIESVCCIVFNCSGQLMFDKKQKSCVKRIHVVTDDGLYDRKAFYTVKFVFNSYSSSMNDGEFINYSSSRSEDMNNFLSILAIFIDFHQFFGFLTFSRYKESNDVSL